MRSADMDAGFSRRRWLAAGAAGGAAAWLGGCAGPAAGWLPPANQAQPLERLPDHLMPPEAPRELRGAWVATVANIDWPSQKGLPAQQQRAEMNAMLETAAALRLNSLLLQVRPSADALYVPGLEPWTEYLTGTQGDDPGWDPLAEWVAGAHRRGIELHAWLNPYRAKAAPATSLPSAQHVSQRRPDLVKTYGTLQWMDPGEPDAQAQTLAVCADVLRRYDIDGLHIDDYFYPYPAKDAQGQDIAFPDEPSYQRLGRGQNLADWRRSNVDALVQQMQRVVRAERPSAAFTISPFGLGKPSLRPPGITGFSQFDQLYADVERWQEQGWCDALVPQLYWPIAQAAQAFPVLLDYWLAQPRRPGRGIWAGLYTSRLAMREGERGWVAQEILDQIAQVRQRADASGHVHFSMVALRQNRLGLADALRAGPYAEDALPPAMPWLDALPVAAPRVSAWRQGGDTRLALTHFDARATRHALWALRQGRWRFQVVPAANPVLTLPAGTELVVASSVTRTGMESLRRAWALAD
ncbi:MAG: glycoside hydrolase family 10 protein [Rubrivivax sp.]